MQDNKDMLDILDFNIEHVNLYYGDKHTLKDVNLAIPHGKVTAFIGPSGCGKSTLLRCLNRMNDLIPNCKIEGSILFKNTDIKMMNPIDLRTRVGMVFQQPNPFPMSILTMWHMAQDVVELGIKRNYRKL